MNVVEKKQIIAKVETLTLIFQCVASWGRGLKKK